MITLSLVDYAVLFGLGSLGSFLAGFLGVGGGIIYVPILDYFLWKMGYRDEELVRAILANSLFTIIFAGLISLYNQYKLQNFYPKEILLAALPAAVGVLSITWFISIGTWYSKIAFNFVFCFLLFFILVRMFVNRKKELRENYFVRPIYYSLAGLFTGIISALSGLGGGVILTPALTDLMNQPVKKSISISNGVIPVLAIAASVLNLNQQPQQMVNAYQVGYIVFPLVIPMLASSFIFARQGVRLSHNTSAEIIKITFATFASIVLLKNIYEILHSFNFI
jgi:uncharacterized membrane protein YfcA